MAAAFEPNIRATSLPLPPGSSSPTHNDRPRPGPPAKVRGYPAAVGTPTGAAAPTGHRATAVGGQSRHAAQLGFVLPGGRRLDFESPLPPDLRAALADLRE